jgi:hypothetical protein
MFVLPLHKLCKEWKLYHWLNIVNIFKKMIDFSFEKRKNVLFNPINTFHNLVNQKFSFSVIRYVENSLFLFKERLIPFLLLNKESTRINCVRNAAKMHSLKGCMLFVSNMDVICVHSLVTGTNLIKCFLPSFSQREGCSTPIPQFGVHRDSTSLHLQRT